MLGKGRKEQLADCGRTERKMPCVLVFQAVHHQAWESRSTVAARHLSACRGPPSRSPTPRCDRRVNLSHWRVVEGQRKSTQDSPLMLLLGVYTPMRAGREVGYAVERRSGRSCGRREEVEEMGKFLWYLCS